MRIISIHNGNVDPDIVKYQKMVFDYLGLEIEQIETTLQHAEALDYELTKPFDTIAIFDIDCIPLSKDAFADWVFTAAIGPCVQGLAQQANHIKESGVYLSPAGIAFSGMTYLKLGKPSFSADNFGDVGYKITEAAQRWDIKQFLMWPIEVEKPLWNLGDSSTFGLGTTYGYINCETGEKDPHFYHAFQSRMGNSEMFVNKCKEVLDGKYK